MANDQETQTVNPKPIHPLARPGAIPTPGGVFPVAPTGGGLRRKRRPHLDLRLHDATVKMGQQTDLLEAAWGIIANAFGGDWSKAPTEWKEAAMNWRSRYFALKPTSAPAKDETPVPTAESLATSEEEKLMQLRGSQPAPVAAGDANLDAFLTRLSALPPSEALKEIPDWNGDDESFADACIAQWSKLHPGDGIGGPKAEDLVPPKTGGPIPQDGPRELVGERGAETIIPAAAAAASNFPNRGAIQDDDDEPVSPPAAGTDSAPPQNAETSASSAPESTERAPAPEGENTESGTGPGGEAPPAADEEGTAVPDRVETLVENLKPDQAEALAGAIEGTAHLRENLPSEPPTSNTPDVPPPPPARKQAKRKNS